MEVCFRSPGLSAFNVVFPGSSGGSAVRLGIPSVLGDPLVAAGARLRAGAALPRTSRTTPMAADAGGDRAEMPDIRIGPISLERLLQGPSISPPRTHVRCQPVFELASEAAASRYNSCAPRDIAVVDPMSRLTGIARTSVRCRCARGTPFLLWGHVEETWIVRLTEGSSCTHLRASLPGARTCVTGVTIAGAGRSSADVRDFRTFPVLQRLIVIAQLPIITGGAALRPASVERADLTPLDAASPYLGIGASPFSCKSP